MRIHLKTEHPELYPKFMLSLGDSVNIGYESEYKEYIDFCNKLKEDYDIRLILNSCGNHDIYQSHWGNWEKFCYPHTSFYKFKTKGISWYCLDTASAAVGFNQYNILMNDIKNDSRKKIIFTHYPFVRFNYNSSNMAETTERNKMISDFAKNNVFCVLGGHNHTQTYDNFGYPDYGLPSFGYNEVWGCFMLMKMKELQVWSFVNRKRDVPFFMTDSKTVNLSSKMMKEIFMKKLLLSMTIYLCKIETIVLK